jgi:hypothetical protein
MNAWQVVYPARNHGVENILVRTVMALANEPIEKFPGSQTRSSLCLCDKHSLLAHVSLTVR